jgi:Protein of unknown function (DUF3352)
MRPPGRFPAPVPLALLISAVIAAPLAGCGSQSSGNGIDPATAVPASAPLFAGAVVRPTGTLRTNAQGAATALSHQANAYLRLLGALQTPGSPPLDFKRDLAPWLGRQAGIFFTSPGAAGRTDAGGLLSLLQQTLTGTASVPFPFAGTGPGPAAGADEGAIVLDSTNAGAAHSFVNRQAARAGAHATSYRGVAYQVTSAGLAFGLVGHFVVIGTEGALQRTVDTNAGSPSLAHGPDYAHLQALASKQTLAHVYLSRSTGSPGASHSSTSPGVLELLEGTRSGTGAATSISLIPQAGAIALDVDTLRTGEPAPGELFVAEPQAARALGELPGDSYLALGFGSAASLGQYVLALRSLAASGSSGAPGAEQTPALSVKGLLGSLLSPVGAMTERSAEARRDFQSWMGPGAVFASGSGLIDLKAGVVISSSNPAASRAAVAKLAAKLRSSGASVHSVSIPGTDAAASANVAGLPIALTLADGRDAQGQTKFVIGLGEASTGAVLNPSSPLSAASAYSTASSSLGEGIQPSVIVQVPTVLALLEAAGLSEDRTIAPVVPLLRSVGAVAAGARSVGAGAERFRAVLALRAG